MVGGVMAGQSTSVLFSQDNKILFWDVRKASGPLCDLDQHNGGGGSHSASGENNMVINFSVPCVLNNHTPTTHTLQLYQPTMAMW